jgi:hypothetical protein
MNVARIYLRVSTEEQDLTRQAEIEHNTRAAGYYIAGVYPVKDEDEDVARLSPLLHEHINMLGRYSFSVPEAVTNGELRPLRNPADDE